LPSLKWATYKQGTGQRLEEENRLGTKPKGSNPDYNKRGEENCRELSEPTKSFTLSYVKQRRHTPFSISIIEEFEK